MKHKVYIMNCPKCKTTTKCTDVWDTLSKAKLSICPICNKKQKVIEQ